MYFPADKMNGLERKQWEYGQTTRKELKVVVINDQRGCV